MYSKVVFDYFNSNTKKFKFKPNKLTRSNAFKKKATKKTVVVPQKSSTSTKIQKTSAPIEDASQKITPSTENRSTVNVVYDTVQCIWKYAKSFISNQNTDSSRLQERSRKKIKYRTSNRNNNFKPLRSVTYDEKEQETTVNEKLSKEIFPHETEYDVIEKVIQHDGNVGEDFFTKTSTKSLALAQSIEEINFENPEKYSVCKELDLFLLDNNNEKLTSKNCDPITNIESQNIKLGDEDTSCKISIKRNQSKNTIKELYVKQQDLQNNNQAQTESLNIVEVQILKSSMKTYGRGKRKNKKLHVHFKDEYDNENRKYSSYTSKNLRKSDCYHPNAFCKKINKHTFDKKKSTHCRGKKRRLALCTKSSRSSLKKKRSKRNSSSNISLLSKSSDCYENKAGKKTRKTPKKYSVYATTKIYKKKRGKNCKRATTNEKSIKALQDIIKTMSDTKFDKSVNDNNDVMKAINIGEVLCSSQHSINLQPAIATGNEQLNITSSENISINN